MKLLRSIILGSVAAAGLMMTPLIGADPIPAQQLQVQPPSKPAPPAAPTVTAARSEVARAAAEAMNSLGRPRRRGGWDGINRKSGDRAHKRLKARRRRGK